MKQITMDYKTYQNELRHQRLQLVNEIIGEFPGLHPSNEDVEVNGADLVDYLSDLFAEELN